MKTKGLLYYVILVFVLAIMTTVVVTLLWNLLIEKQGAVVDWKTSFLLAIILSMVIPVVRNTYKVKLPICSGSK
jgi:hypothetical protein